jgi:hypothetical protein
MRRTLALVLLVLAAAGCERGQTQAPAPVDAQLDPVVPNPHGDMRPLPDPEQQEGRVGRSPRRITADQLGRSIEVAVGRPWTQLRDLAASLGKPDYASSTSEATEPNLVFAKFLEDGAREVCLAQATAEIRLTDPQQRVLSRTIPGTVGDLTRLTPAQVNALLEEQSLRFWGTPLQGEELARWAGFFNRAATVAESKRKREQAFAALCIALLTDERFFTY